MGCFQFTTAFSVPAVHHSLPNDNFYFNLQAWTKPFLKSKNKQGKRTPRYQEENLQKPPKKVSTSDQDNPGKQLMTSWETHLQIFSSNAFPVTGKQFPWYCLYFSSGENRNQAHFMGSVTNVYRGNGSQRKSRGPMYVSPPGPPRQRRTFSWQIWVESAPEQEQQLHVCVSMSVCQP